MDWVDLASLGSFNKAGNRAGGGGWASGTISPTILQARKLRSRGRMEAANFNSISSYPGPWILPGCLEATPGPEPTTKPVSSAGRRAGG